MDPFTAALQLLRSLVEFFDHAQSRGEVDEDALIELHFEAAKLAKFGPPKAPPP